VLVKKESLSLLIEYIILETRAAREWIKANVNPEDPNEGADLLIAYNDGITKLDALSWIKKIRKLIPINYQQLGIPLSPGEVTQTDIEYGDSIDILYIVDLVKKFLEPQNQNMMRGAGIHTNLTTSYYPNVMALKNVIDLIEKTNKRREEEKIDKRPSGESFVSDDNPQGFDPDSVDVLGQVGPWSVLMPITVGGSIACDISTARDTTWCTTKRAGENLFHNYVGSGQNVVLFYVMDYSRKPDDPNAKREKSCMANNDSRLSIGYVAGSPALGGGHGGLSVDAANKGLTADDLQRVLGPHYDQIMKLLKEKYDSIGGVHPAQGIVDKAAGDIFFLRDTIKDYKPATKQSFYGDMSNYWSRINNEKGIEACLEVFSPEVINFLFWQSQAFHNTAREYVYRNPSAKSIKDYIRKIDAATPADKWLFSKDLEDTDMDLVDDDFGVHSQSNWDRVADTKARALMALVSDIGTKLNKNTLTLIHNSVVRYLYKAYKTDEYIINSLGSQINLIRPKNLDEETFARYVILEYARTKYRYGHINPDALPDDIIEFQREYKQIPVTDLVNQVIEDAQNKIDDFKAQRKGNLDHVYTFDLKNNVFANISSMLSNPTGDRFLNEQDFNALKIKENYLKYFELAKEYDRNEIDKTEREFPVEIMLSKSIYDKILHYQFTYMLDDLKVPMDKIQHVIQPTGEIAYKLLEMFPGIKSFPLIAPYKITNYFDELKLNGMLSAANAVGSILAGGALSTSAVEKIVTEDFPNGYFYTFINNKDKYQTDKIAFHLLENVKCTKFDKYIIGSFKRYIVAKYPERTLELLNAFDAKEKEMEATTIDDILDIEVEY
jgi:hypothetical protein